MPQVGTSQELWGRVWSLQVGTVFIEGRSASAQGEDVDSLNVEFKVKKSLQREPNTAEITIWNLAKSTRDAITQLGSDASVILRAGYDGTGLDTIFQGDLRASPGEWDGPSVKTKLEGNDGGNSYRNTRVQRSFPRNTPVGTVLQAGVEAMGLGLGNLPQVKDSLELTTSGRVYPDGTILSGPARDEVNRVVAGCGASWSIQNGAFKIRTSTPDTATAIRLTPRTGLIGSPTKSQGDDESFIHAETLLIPGMYPGRVVVLESKEFTGQYEIHRVEYVGETRGTDWGGKLELKEY